MDLLAPEVDLLGPVQAGPAALLPVQAAEAADPVQEATEAQTGAAVAWRHL